MRIVADGHEAVPAVSGIDEAVRAGLDQAAGAGGAVAFLKVHVSVVCCFVSQVGCAYYHNFSTCEISSKKHLFIVCLKNIFRS